MRNFVLVGFAALASLVAAPASAENFCVVKPGQKWISRLDAKKIAEKAGYTKIRMGMEAGCFEAEVEKNGIQYEIFIHPVTGKIIKVRKDID